MVTLLMVDNFSITHPRADAVAGSRGATPPSAPTAEVGLMMVTGSEVRAP